MRVRNQDLTFDIFTYCCSEDTIISSFPIDENETVQLTEKVKVYILMEARWPSNPGGITKPTLGGSRIPIKN